MAMKEMKQYIKQEMKQYIKPEVLVIEAEPTSLLAGSDGDDDKPGEKYEEIEFGEGYRKEFD